MPLIIKKLTFLALIFAFLVPVLTWLSTQTIAWALTEGFSDGTSPGVTGTCQDHILAGEPQRKPPPQEPEFELDYPTIKGVKPIEKGVEAVPVFVQYIFYFAIAIAGLVAFAALVYGGFRYLASAGSPTAMADAKSQITAGLLGLIILLGAVILLNTINPELPTLVLEPIEIRARQLGQMAGVYLIDDEKKLETEVDKKVNDEVITLIQPIFDSRWTEGSVPDLATPGWDFDNKTKHLCINTSWREDINFNVVLHSERDFKGKCRIFKNTGNTYYENLDGRGIGDDVKGDVSSVTIFTNEVLFPKEPASDFAVKFFKEPMFDDDPDGDGNREEKDEVCTVKDERVNITSIEDECGFGWNDEVNSLKVGEGWVLVAFEHPNGTGKCEVFAPGRDKEVSEIRTYYLGRCKVGMRWGPFGGEWKPCISSFAIFKGNLR